MNCKRCGSPLPSQGYICSHCGMLMSSEQIEIQKTLLKDNNAHLKADLVSERYGGKKQIFQGREGNDNKYISIFLLFGVIALILLIAIIVYFL